AQPRARGARARRPRARGEGRDLSPRDGSQVRSPQGELSMRLARPGHRLNEGRALGAAAVLATALAACGGSGSGLARGLPGTGGEAPDASGAAGAAAGTTGAAGGVVDAGAALDVGPVTYYRDVQPIVAEHCQMCHVEGGIAPFALGTYDEAKPVAAI